MDLNQLATFIQVFESGSFTQAAKLLRQPKSRISRSIAALEQQIGIPLIYRTTRQFSPTEAGRSLYEKCVLNIRTLEVVGRNLQEDVNEVSGSLKISTTTDVGTYLLGPMINHLSKIYPKLHIDLHLSDEVIDLVRHRIDLAIRIGTLKDSSLKKKLLGKISFVLVASPNYLARSGKLESVKDLIHHKTLIYPAMLAGDSWLLHSKYSKAIERVPIKAHCQVNSPKMLLDLAVADHGVALLPDFLCKENIKNEALVRILPAYATKSLPVQFVWPAQKEDCPKVRVFIELGIEYLTSYF